MRKNQNKADEFRKILNAKFEAEDHCGDGELPIYLSSNFNIFAKYSTSFVFTCKLWQI